MCAEQVLNAAQVCRHCGHTFVGSGADRTARLRKQGWIWAAVLVVLVAWIAYAVITGIGTAERKADDVRECLEAGLDADCQD